MNRPSHDIPTPRDASTEQTTAKRTSDAEPSASDGIDLTAKLDPRWALSLGHVALAAVVAFLFLLLHYLPLQTSDVWGRLGYGAWVLQHGEFPAKDPSMSFAEGMPAPTATWLTDVALAWVAARGENWLSLLFACTAFGVLALWLAAFFMASNSFAAAGTSVALTAAMSWSHYTGLRAYHLAGLCFAAALCIDAWSQRRFLRAGDGAASACDKSGWGLWAATATLFALWANLHPSVVWGVALLMCRPIGEAIETAWRARSLRAAANNPSVRQSFFIAEIAAVATLFNPAGIDLWLGAAWWEPSRIYRDLADWQPLFLTQSPGREFALSIAALMAALRLGTTPLGVARGLMLAVFAAAAIFGQARMLWYAPVFGYVIVGQLADIAARWRRPATGSETLSADASPAALSFWTKKSWFYTLSCLLLLWIAFTLSDASRPLLGGAPRSPQQLYGKRVPLQMTEYLRQNPPTGNVFHPQWWGDWLDHHGPEQFRPFVTSRVESIPNQVWQDYLRVMDLRVGWLDVLDRYRLETVLVDRERQPSLMDLLRSDPNWTIQHQDEQAMVFAWRAPSPRERATTPKNDPAITEDKGPPETERITK